MAEAARRIRVSRTAPTVIPAKDTRRMDELLTSLCSIEHKLKSLANTKQDEEAELLALLQKYKQTETHNKAGAAKVVIPAGRRKITIDPVKFRKAVDSDKDFFASIVVGMEKAKQVLSEKEIEKISTVTPATPGEPTLKVTPV